MLSKTLRKAIMTRSRLRNKFNLNRNPRYWKKYKQQHNLCVKLLRKNKKDYFNNINVQQINDNKRFWKTVRPNFSNKTKTANTIILSEKEKIIKDETDGS